MTAAPRAAAENARLDARKAHRPYAPTVRRYGRLTRATGLVLEATGLQLPLGATCLIERHDGR
jgi:flagellum-specific ATP synthase